MTAPTAAWRWARAEATAASTAGPTTPQPELSTPELCGLDDCQRGAGHTGPGLPPVTKEDA